MKIEIEVKDLDGFHEFFYQHEDCFDSYGDAEKDLNRMLKQLKKLKAQERLKANAKKKVQSTPQDAS